MKVRHFVANTIAILFFVSPVCAAEVTLGDSFEVTTGLTSPQGQHNPRAAFGANNIYLVVWEQGTDLYQTYTKQVFAARVQVEKGVATVLDKSGLHLLSSSNSQQRPRVTFGNGVFLVVWQELSPISGFDVKGVLVNSNGKILGPVGLNLSKQPHNQITPDLVYDTTNNRFFVVWADYRNGEDYQIYGARVQTDGTIKDESGIHLATDIADVVALTPTVGANGTKLLVNWSRKYKNMWPGSMISNLYDLNGALLSNVLTVETGKWAHVGPKGQTAFHPEPQLDIISNGTDFAFLFRAVFQTRYLATYGLPLFRVLSDGTLTNTINPIDIDKNMHAFSASAASLGVSGYAVVWEGLGPGKDERESDHNIYMARINRAVTENADYDKPIAIANTAAAELYPSIAANGSELLVVYEEDNLKDYPSTRDVLRARVVKLSTALATPPENVPPGRASKSQGS
jgi:hypothetical protein